MPSTIHISKHGTYHPAPESEEAWTVHDTRGYLDGGPPCDECGACECNICEGECGECGTPCDERACRCENHGDGECIGLSFAFICLDGGDTYCRNCFGNLASKGEVVIEDCTCD